MYSNITTSIDKQFQYVPLC